MSHETGEPVDTYAHVSFKNDDGEPLELSEEKYEEVYNKTLLSLAEKINVDPSHIEKICIYEFHNKTKGS